MQPKRVYCLVILLFFFSKSFCQVNLQTGSAVFSVPMFSWQDHKSRLNSVVALNYSSGNGLKVNDLPSSVGQGWSLIAGGAIVRMQVGEPDDQVARNGNGTEYDLSRYPPGILYATVPASQGCPNALTRYPIYGWRNQLYSQRNIVAEDKQLDYFSFQFNGKSGMFVLDPSNIGVAQSLGDTKMKITFQRDASLINQGIRTDITSFTITDVDGVIYKFARHGLAKVLQANYCDASLTYMQRQPDFKNGNVYHQAGFDNGQITNPWIIGSWYLSEIEDGLTHRKIYFNYVMRNINNIAGQDIVYNTYTNGTQYTIISHKTSVTQSPSISSISYPDGHTASFTYGSDRVDLKGDKVLSSVDFAYQGRSLSRYILNTTYIIRSRYGKPVTNFQKKSARLCLKSVQKIGVDLKEDTAPYIFDYYLGSGNGDDFVPPPFFYAKDIWGFYNGNNSVAYNGATIPLDVSITSLNNNQLKGLCFLNQSQSGVYLSAKPGYAKNGLLKQVVYPTGGSLSYLYGQNVGILGGVSRNVGGVQVSQTRTTDGGHSNDCSNPIITTYNYVMNGPGSASSLWGLEMPVNSISGMNHYQPEYKAYHWTWSCAPFGCCYWKFQYPGIQFQQQAIDLTGFQKFMESAAPVLGIISVVSTIVDVVTLCLGPTPLAIVAVVVDVVCGLVTLAITCIGSQQRDRYYTIYYNSDMNGVAPLPAQFKRVEVVENPGTIGKTVHEFTSDEDYPIWVQSNPVFSAKQRFAPWAYGLPKKTQVYKAGGTLVKETINEYVYDEIDGGCGHGIPCYPKAKKPLNSKSCKCFVLKSASQRNTHWADQNQYNNPSSYITSSNSDLQVDIYSLYTGRTELRKTHERIYGESNPSQVLQTTTEYLYNALYLPYLITRTESNGTVESKKIKYSGEYHSYSVYNGPNQPPTIYDAGVLTLLNNANIVETPISTVSAFYRDGTFYTGEKVTEFAQLSNGDIKPYRILEQRFDKPQPQLIQQPGGGWVMNFHEYVLPAHPLNPTYKQPQTFTYNAGGDLIGIKDESNRQVVNIYDYNEKYVVASVINADPLTDYCSYTSFETSNYGGWTINGPISNVSQSVTGDRSLAFTASNSISSSLNANKPYTLSFWASNSSVSVSGGASQIKNAPTRNGFTYYEYEIAQGTSSISITGNCTLDELRLYPKMSRMRTVTYDPLVGKTSECDASSRCTYFEYDKLGRILFEKDENRNILKMYEYNNVSPIKQNGCPTTYYNNHISEVFTRNNCGPGYIGGEVTFSVPANRYTSVISQMDADAQAEIDLQTNGQAYANSNASCHFIYFNTLQSRTETTQNCGPGYIGGTVTYTVPAGRYNSLISQADADSKAMDDLLANSQAYANDPAHAVCSIDTNPDWTWLEGAAYYCQSINGNLPPHMFVLETDMNPNSSSYQQTRWSDVGPSDECPANTYYNSLQSGSFVKNDCPPGYTGSSVTYTVAAGAYSSTSSQAAADQLAFNEINANGQAYANTYGTCGSSSIDLYYNYYVSGYEYGNIEFYNNSTGESFYFSVYSSYGGYGYLGSVSPGNYTITFYPSYTYYNYHSFGAGCDFATYGYGPLTLYNIDLSVNCNLITISQ